MKFTTAQWHVGTILLCLAVVPTCRLVCQDTIPAGYGTLRRDDIVARFTTGTLEIQVLPLDEQVIRLLAEHPTLVMVTFRGIVPQARFNPEELSITSRGRLFRPIGIVPLSPTWSSFQLDARQQAAAIYLFEPGIGVREELTVSYQGMASDAWSRSIRLLDQERARVKARAQLEAKRDSGAL